MIKVANKRLGEIYNMNSVNLYILCEGTKLVNWVDYQKVLTNST